ncbi:MAG: alkaline phosphatase D family protein [Reichenbachiella sp.]|uniref:alkaline phosphatase D family protein n=1 Tax=Reichenbachiella sp. TaxID=2184521 RepID=UPI003266E8ED
MLKRIKSMCAESKYKNLIAGVLGSFFLWFSISCSDADSEQLKADFSVINREWVGPEYWANPLQDWEIKNGSIVCNVAKPNRDLHLLTHEVSDEPGYFMTSVQAKVLNSLPPSDDNWVGFKIGKKGKFNDYRDDAIYGKGIEIGVTTKGLMFVRNNETKVLGTQNIDAGWLQRGLVLSVSISDHVESQAELVFSLTQTSGDTIRTLRFDDWQTTKFNGSFSIVSHFQPPEDKSEHQGTAFLNWYSEGSKLKYFTERKFGPLLFAQYTEHQKEVKMSIQMTPVGEFDDKEVSLELKNNQEWTKVSASAIDPMTRTAHFRFTNPFPIEDTPFRACYSYVDMNMGIRTDTLIGTIRAEPLQKDELVVAALSCNRDLGFPANDLVSAIKYHKPDLLFFGGDQLYESTGGFGTQRTPLNKATLDYLRKWYQFGWAYGELTNNYPTVTIPDDHDVFHGNLWGEGGHSVADSLGQGAKAQDYGGFKMPATWVNMVQKSQTWHLPDPVDPEPVQQGIGVYFTELKYAGISFAILEDRKWKSAPKNFLPEAGIYNGWPENQSWSAQTQSKVENATLLGERQHRFLEDWTADWSGDAWMKVLLSQTIFHNIGTLPRSAINDNVVPKLKIMKPGEYPSDDRPVSDFDTNGWPQQGRDRAIRTLRKAFAFHIAGDQHLGSTSQYGVDGYDDGGYAFCVPAISNIWPRRWFPSEPGMNPSPEFPKVTGGFLDGFGNKMTVNAVANPFSTGRKPIELYDRAAGYGIVRLNKETRDIVMECWPRFQDLSTGEGVQYPGWPIKINQLDNYGKKAVAYLPEIEIEGMENAVIEVINEADGERVYSVRVKGKSFRPKVFDKGVYTLRIGNPDGEMKIVKNIKAGSNEKINLSF